MIVCLQYTTFIHAYGHADQVSLLDYPPTFISNIRVCYISQVFARVHLLCLPTNMHRTFDIDAADSVHFMPTILPGIVLSINFTLLVHVCIIWRADLLGFDVEIDCVIHG